MNRMKCFDAGTKIKYIVAIQRCQKKNTYIFDEILYFNPSSLVACFFLDPNLPSLPLVGGSNPSEKY